jgi:hypothetical protein
MKNDKILEMINEYFDNELESGKEIILFTQLSQSEAGREYFKIVSRIKSDIASAKEFPEELDERILRSVGKSSAKKISFFSEHKIFSSVAYVSILLLILLSGYLLIKFSSYQEKVDMLSTRLNLQSKTIQVLFNSLPGIEIKASTDNHITVKPNI